MTRREWRHVSPEEATPDTPLWQIVHKGKEAVFRFEGRERPVRFGAPEPFGSFEEFRAFARFVHDHPDFCLHSGHEQDPIDPQSVHLDGDYVTYTTVGLGMPEPQTLSVPVDRLHRKVWVSQLPWEPIPREHRHWLPPPWERAGGPEYWRVGTTEGAGEDCWPYMQAGGYVSIGWKYLGDLRVLLAGLDESAARAMLRRSVSGSNDGVVTRYVNQIHDFFAVVRPGDYVAAMNGRRLLDVGEVTGDYEWVDDHSPQASRRAVRWLGLPERGWPDGPGFRTTLYRFTDRPEDVAFVRRAAGLDATRYWAIQANPTFYDIERALREVDEDTWFIDNTSVQVGDRVLIWKSRGGDDWSGIVGLAEVVEAGAPREPLHREYFRKPLSEERLARERFLLRFARTDKLPIRKEDLRGPLAELTVARGLQGNVFKVTPEQWDALMEAVGGWPATQGEIMTAAPAAPLNRILYGPPGTGKTFATVRRAVEVCDPRFRGDDQAAYKARYDELRADGRIEFVTFHQSYGYEDFVEGIRPVMDDENGSARFQVVDGVLKRLALRALEDALEPTPVTPPGADGGATGLPTWSQVWGALLAEAEAQPDRTFPGATPRTRFRFEVTQRGNLLMHNEANGDTRPQTLSADTAAEWWDAFSRGDESRAERIARSGHYPARAIAFEQLKRIARAWPQNAAADGVVPAAPFSRGADTADEVAVRDYLRHGARSGFRLRRETPRFVLIVDEINRGNVSKVLGELITLLEDDKRVGEENALTVTLPYSREPFGLPPNLHVLGTMNTADKSIALVDVALRRRFDFEELAPDFSVCRGLTPGMRAVLEELNRRIALRLDRDHRIGHAFFVRVTDGAGFDAVFRRKVVPLLQEYFYNDWDGLRYVLGETQDAGEFLRRPEGHQAREARTRWQWRTDGGEPLTPLASLRANYGVTQE